MARTRKAVAALAALSAGLGLVVEARDERADCLRAQEAFCDAFKLLPIVPQEETLERLRAIHEARVEAEKADRPNLECLNVRCFNETCDAVGTPEGKKPLTFLQATLGQVVRLRYVERTK